MPPGGNRRLVALARPLDRALDAVAQGVGAGSAMILLVAEVGTNLSTLGPVGQVMGRRTAVWYAVSVVLLAASFGFILKRVW